jgi:hypothetical protein
MVTQGRTHRDQSYIAAYSMGQISFAVHIKGNVNKLGDPSPRHENSLQIDDITDS